MQQQKLEDSAFLLLPARAARCPRDQSNKRYTVKGAFMRVLKFGGTSVANAERFINVADIAVSTAKQTETALVLSAPAKITNL